MPGALRPFSAWRTAGDAALAAGAAPGDHPRPRETRGAVGDNPARTASLPGRQGRSPRRSQAWKRRAETRCQEPSGPPETASSADRPRHTFIPPLETFPPPARPASAPNRVS
ncbi:uncharacterized protein M6G45_015331 [Spheniscus humboldti]